MVNYDTCGTYSFKLLIENKEVEYLVFSVFGEGNQYIENVRVLTCGEKRLPIRVETLCGNVINPEKVLKSDNSFAELGYESGYEHVNNVSLAKEVSAIKIFF